MTGRWVENEGKSNTVWWNKIQQLAASVRRAFCSPQHYTFSDCSTVGHVEEMFLWHRRRPKHPPRHHVISHYFTTDGYCFRASKLPEMSQSSSTVSSAIQTNSGLGLNLLTPILLRSDSVQTVLCICALMINSVFFSFRAVTNNRHMNINILLCTGWCRKVTY